MFIILTVFLIGLASCQSEVPSFNWSSITPTTDLQYHNCYNDVFRCARLQVPLDWSKPNSADRYAAIAIITLPATVSESDPTFGGTIIYNNGGPGQAGTDAVQTGMLSYLQDLLDGDRHYELMSFDPRGVFRSTPGASCYTSELARLMSYNTRFALGRLAADKDDLPEHIAFQAAESKLCEEQLADVLPYISSASTARDMVEIIDKVEHLRQRSSNTTDHTSYNSTSKPRLQYIGPSYGSALGQYFAAMFPDRVGRIFLDGVIDIEDWNQGLYRTWFSDAEAGLNDFFERCFAAGSSACPLVTPEDSDWTSIRRRVEGLLREIDSRPVPLVAAGGPTALTSNRIRQRILNPGIWVPIATYPGLAADLALFLAGNFTSLAGAPDADLAASIAPTLAIPPLDPYTIPKVYGWVLDAQIAITCLDASPEAGNRSVEYYNEYLRFAESQSPTMFNGLNPSVALGCAGRTIRPAYSFTGPFTFPAPGSGANSPETGILFGTTRHDPATPNAEHMSALFPGSASLIQEGNGHCIIFNQPSECSRSIIRGYFDTGVLPSNGTVCERQCSPWEECTPISALDPAAGGA